MYVIVVIIIIIDHMFSLVLILNISLSHSSVVRKPISRLFVNGTLFFHFGRREQQDNVSIDLSQYGTMKVECTCGYSSTANSNNNSNNSNRLLCDHIWNSLRCIASSIPTKIFDGDYIIQRLLYQDRTKLATIILNRVFENNKLIRILEKRLEMMNNYNGIRETELPFKLAITTEDVKLYNLFDEICQTDEVIRCILLGYVYFYML